MHVGLQRKRAELAASYDAIVVGSGMGGMAAAACLARAGRRVIICERHTTAGGFTHTFSRGQYVWDVGVHYVGDVSSPESKLRRTFDYLSKGQLTWQPMDEIYDAIEVDGKTYELVAGREQFRRQMYNYFPREKLAIDGYLRLVATIGRSSGPFFLQKALSGTLRRFLYRPMSKNFLDLAQETTGAVLGRLTDNRTLIRVLTGQWGDYGLPPESSSFAIHAMVASHYFHGASYPSGGAAAIAQSIYPVIRDAGGEILLGAEVAGVQTDRLGVTGIKLSSGEFISSRCVISDIGFEKTYRKFVAQHRALPHEVDAYLASKPYSMGHICLYLGLKGDAHSLGLRGSNLWLHRSSAVDPNFAALSGMLGAETGVVFISFPSVKDPEWPIRHPDLSTIEVIAPADFERFRVWHESSWQRRGQDYLDWKGEVSRILLEILYSRLPALRSKIDVAELSTPLSTKHFASYNHGEIYGLRHDPLRFKQSWLRVDTPIQGLYLTGQDLVTCGVSGALISGVLTAARVLKAREAWTLLRNTIV